MLQETTFTAYSCNYRKNSPCSQPGSTTILRSAFIITLITSATNPATMVLFEVVPYDPAWPKQFQAIKEDLIHDLALEKAQYLSIEHVGSTSVPGLCAKPIIDILITIGDPSHLASVKYALTWGERQGGYRHRGDGGVSGRASFKLDGVLPARNLYVVPKDHIVIKSHLALRETLRKEENNDLKEEYGKLKMELAGREWNDVMEFATAKNGVIRKILGRAGWTDEEIDAKEGGAVKNHVGTMAY